MMPIKRAEAIAQCFQSHTCCKWTTENFLYVLTPMGSSMRLHCESLVEDSGTGITYTVTNAGIAYFSYANCLKLDLDDGLILEFKLEDGEGSE